MHTAQDSKLWEFYVDFLVDGLGMIQRVVGEVKKWYELLTDQPAIRLRLLQRFRMPFSTQIKLVSRYMEELSQPTGTLKEASPVKLSPGEAEKEV